MGGAPTRLFECRVIVENIAVDEVSVKRVYLFGIIMERKFGSNSLMKLRNSVDKVVRSQKYFFI